MPLQLYGLDPSQPYRSVKWILLLKNIPFEEVFVKPGSKGKNGSRSPEYLQLCPVGTVPMIKEEDGYCLWESHAIMIYLAEKHNWTDLYPKDLKLRGKVNQWLHWHHQNTRRFSLAIFAPIARPDMKFSKETLDSEYAVVLKTASLMNDHLKNNNFFVGDQLTLADIALYGDLGQLAKHHLDLFDFAKYANLHAWMERMRSVPKYDEAHAVMPQLKQAFGKMKSAAKM